MQYKQVLIIIVILATTYFLILYHMHTRRNPTRRLPDTKQVTTFDLKKPPFKVLKQKWHESVNPVPKFPFGNSDSYLLEPSFVCSHEKPILALVLIHSSPYHVNRRKLIRSTWGNSTYLAIDKKFKLLFLFGTPKDRRLQEVINSEHRTHGDILQGHFSDSYFNLSFNTMMGLRWTKDRCRNCKVVMKVDDDIVIDMFSFIHKVVLKFAEKSKQVFCSYKATRIFRNKGSKHYVSHEYFEGKKSYPRHCEGKVVMITNDMTPLLYECALITPFFFIEDVYFYGLVMNKIQEINITQMVWNEDFQLQSYRAKQCLRIKKKNCRYLIAGADSEDDIVQLWLLFMLRNSNQWKVNFTIRPNTSTIHI